MFALSEAEIVNRNDDYQDGYDKQSDYDPVKGKQVTMVSIALFDAGLIGLNQLRMPQLQRRRNKRKVAGYTKSAQVKAFTMNLSQTITAKLSVPIWFGIERSLQTDNALKVLATFLQATYFDDYK